MISIPGLLQGLLAPTQCVICKKMGSYLCSAHAANLLAYPDSCWICQTPTHNAQCCLQHHEESPLQGVVVGFYYTRIIQYLIHKSKYSGAHDLLSYFGSTLALMILANKPLVQAINDRKLIISYVPMHPRKERYDRGYNQAHKLALSIANELHVPCVKLVEKTQYTFSQVTKGRFARQKMLSGKYKIASGDVGDNTVILLVDDIITTGSTLSSVATCLQEKYRSNQIRGLCIARNK